MAGRKFRSGILVGACGAALGLCVPPAAAQAAAPPGAEAGTPFELAFWQAVATSNDPVLYEAYLKQYPGGTFAAIARAKTGGLHTPLPAIHAPALSPPAPQFGAGFDMLAPGAADALKDAVAAQRTAEAAQAAAVVAAPIPADRPVVTALMAPPAPIAAPAFAVGQATAGAAQDVFGNTAAMPVGSAALLATLSGDAAVPALAEPVRPAFAELAPAPMIAPPSPTAPTAMLAVLGAAPHALPTAEALEAAVAAQTTPARLAGAEMARAELAHAELAHAELAGAVPYAAPAPVRLQYAASAFTPRARVTRAAMPARFPRAVISTAAVSVEMPDATSQISPLGIMLGQMVRTQETPGTQFGLQEEVAMPMRPRLMAMPEVALPESFCSIEQRSAFNEGIYQPALAIAQHNAQIASGYVRKLRTLYDNYQLSGDSTALTSVAAEARDFSRAANAASSIHDALVDQFEDIMTTPIGSCGAIQ